MISRRRFLQRSSAACVLSAAPMTKLVEAAVGSKKTEDPLRWVDPRIGTGGHGHCFPGAAMPFGMVQLSPDTFNDGWDWCSGYHVSDDSIMGFSHTHLSGTGCGDLLDFLIMPERVTPNLCLEIDASPIRAIVRASIMRMSIWSLATTLCC